MPIRGPDRMPIDRAETGSSRSRLFFAIELVNFCKLRSKVSGVFEY